VRRTDRFAQLSLPLPYGGEDSGIDLEKTHATDAVLSSAADGGLKTLKISTRSC